MSAIQLFYCSVCIRDNENSVEQYIFNFCIYYEQNITDLVPIHSNLVYSFIIMQYGRVRDTSLRQMNIDIDY